MKNDWKDLPIIQIFQAKISYIYKLFNELLLYILGIVG